MEHLLAKLLSSRAQESEFTPAIPMQPGLFQTSPLAILLQASSCGTSPVSPPSNKRKSHSTDLNRSSCTAADLANLLSACDNTNEMEQIQTPARTDSTVNLLLTKLKILQEVRMRAEAEAVAAAAAVDLVLPKSLPNSPRESPAEWAESSRQLKFITPEIQEEVCSGRLAHATEGQGEREMFQEVTSLEAANAVIPNSLPELDFDQIWCDDVLDLGNDVEADQTNKFERAVDDAELLIMESASDLTESRGHKRWAEKSGDSQYPELADTPCSKRGRMSEPDVHPLEVTLDEFDSYPPSAISRHSSGVTLGNLEADAAVSGVKKCMGGDPADECQTDPKAANGRLPGSPISSSSNGSRPKKQRQKRGTATDPQSLAARARREKIANRMKTLHELVPGSDSLDTATMLQQAIEYVRQMKAKVQQAQTLKNFGGQAKGCGTDSANHAAQHQLLAY